MTDALVVHEIFLSLQGESTFAGWPCVFVRLTGCNLRCTWCDTAYAFTGGQRLGLEEILTRVKDLARPFTDTGGLTRLPLVELTGGEPLLQASALPLLTKLCDLGFTVLLETNGAMDIAPVDARVHRVMDLKCPASGEEKRNRWENLRHLKKSDEIKFVIASREDYEWAKQVVAAHHLAGLCPLSFSWAEPLPAEPQDKPLEAEAEVRPDAACPACDTEKGKGPQSSGFTPITRRQLAEWIIADALPVRLGVQLHKVVWPAEMRGV